MIFSVSGGATESAAQAISDRYVPERFKEFMCPWCGRTRCNNECLLSHTVASEIVERVLKL